MIVAMFWKKLPIQIAVADSVADSKIQVRIGNRQLVAGCRFQKKKKKTLLLSSFVSRMLVAILWQRLPIQIVFADSVADSKTQVRIGNRQLHVVADSKRTVIIV